MCVKKQFYLPKSRVLNLHFLIYSYMKMKKLESIDAIHAALAGTEIISFDKDFDKAGIKRISDEKN